jgi:hypothetical protein
MFGLFTDHEYLACDACGTPLSRAERETHVCDSARRMRFEAFQAGQELADFDRQLAVFLRSPAGRFAAYYADRDRRRRTRSDP